MRCSPVRRAAVSALALDAHAAIGGTDLIQILMNLGVNALQATLEQHRVEISAERLDRELDLQKFVDGKTPEDWRALIHGTGGSL